MKKLILILIAALFMVGCKNNDRNEPDLRSKVYLKGYKVYGVPYNGTYYKFSYDCHAAAMISSFSNETDWSKELYNSNLQMILRLENPKYICQLVDYIYFDKITFRVFYYSQAKPSGTLCMEKTIEIDGLHDDLSKFGVEELIFRGSDGKTKVGVLFEFR